MIFEDVRHRAAWGLAALALAAAGCSEGEGGGLGLSPHDGYFKVSGSHQAFSCDQCHEPAAPSFTAVNGGVSCTGCHASADVTPRHASVSGFDGATPSCVGCHRGGTVNVDHSALFPIAAGTVHASVGCAECHGATKAKLDLQCAGCHGHHEQAAMDAAHAGLAGYVFASVSCVGCHADGRVPAFTHAFDRGAASAHGGVSCAQCHGATRAVADLRCFECHTQATMDGWHTGLPNYSNALPSCVSCHRDGHVPAFEHAFAIASGSAHAPPGVRCTDCHGATTAAADLKCTGCHQGANPHDDQARMASLHAGVANYAFSSPSCASCHPTGSAGLPANHNTAFFPVTGSHAGVACSKCHGATRALADVTCLTSGCHAQAATDPAHLTSLPSLPTNRPIPASTTGDRGGRFTNYQYATAYCLKCHADGQVDTLASHPRVDHGLNGGDHQPFCLTCHQVARTDKPWAVDFGKRTCLACHDSENPN